MNRISQSFKNSGRILPVLLMITWCACKKADNTYRNATPQNRVNQSIYDYLKSRKGTFDSLVYIIDKAGLKDTLQKNGYTFFVPSDQSISIAMENLNAARRSKGLLPATMDSVDAFIWRSMLMRYIIPGRKQSKDFAEKDGVDVITMNRQRLHVDAVRTSTEGVMAGGSFLLKYSDMNGSRFIKDWIFSFVTTADLEADNGIMHIMERNHVFGFRSFVEKAGVMQNIYSDNYIASGVISFPAGTTRPWYDRAKVVTAINAETCEVEGADLLASVYIMRLKVLPDNSVLVTSAPQAANQTIANDGICRYDPVNRAFILSYKYSGADGFRKITETITLRNF